MTTFIQKVLGNYVPVEAVEPPSMEKSTLLWNRPLKGLPAPQLSLLFGPLGRLFSNAALFWLLLALGLFGGLWFGYLIRQGQTSLIPFGPRDYGLKLVAVWLCANAATLVRMGATSAVCGGERCSMEWRLFLGIPFLKISDPGLLSRPWQDALRRRLSGVAFLWVAVTALTFWIWLDPQHRVNEARVILITGGFFVGLLQLSPWWNSPAAQSFKQALPGQGYPWCCWNFMWGGLWKSLFGSGTKAPGEDALIGATLAFILWNLLALRMAAFVKRHMALLMYIDSINAEDSATSGLALAATVITGGICLLVIATLLLMVLIRLIAEIGRGFSGKPGGEVPAPPTAG